MNRYGSHISHETGTVFPQPKESLLNFVITGPMAFEIFEDVIV